MKLKIKLKVEIKILIALTLLVFIRIISFELWSYDTLSFKRDIQVLNRDNLKRIIQAHNENLVIKNKHFIKDLLENERKNSRFTFKNLKPNSTQKKYDLPKFMVILVQVHSRVSYLNELIKSLQKTNYIEQTLVIFSHDFYDEQINKLVDSIDFCAVRF